MRRGREVHHRLLPVGRAAARSGYGAFLGLILGILLTLAVLMAANLVDFGARFATKPVEHPTTSQMMLQQFAIEHHTDIDGTTGDQLRRVFFLEPKADLDP